LQVSTYAPHEPYTPAPRHADAFPDIQAPRTPSFNAEDVSGKPSDIRYNPPLSEADIQDIDSVHRLRVQSMQAVDEMIERLMNTLDELNLLDNTYIFFISDNGFHLGQHRMKPGKAHQYEEDIRVPMIVRGPGIPAGMSVDNFLTANIDFPPTIAELAGVIPPEYVDGRSLVPLLKNTPPPAEEWRQAVQIEFFGHQLDESGEVSPWYIGLRTNDHLYVEHSEGMIELYNLHADPNQLNNLAPEADPERIKLFSQWLRAIYNSSGIELREIEQNNPL
jgi:arylsulfatase A-like enzyme